MNIVKMGKEELTNDPDDHEEWNYSSGEQGHHGLCQKH